MNKATKIIIASFVSTVIVVCSIVLPLVLRGERAPNHIRNGIYSLSGFRMETIAGNLEFTLADEIQEELTDISINVKNGRFGLSNIMEFLPDDPLFDNMLIQGMLHNILNPEYRLDGYYVNLYVANTDMTVVELMGNLLSLAGTLGAIPELELIVNLMDELEVAIIYTPKLDEIAIRLSITNGDVFSTIFDFLGPLLGLEEVEIPPLDFLFPLEISLVFSLVH